MSAAAKPRKRKTKTTTSRVSVPRRKAKLHVAAPASAEEIRASLGISPRVVREMRALVRSLGYGSDTRPQLGIRKSD